jgi:hypothetical protein
MKDISHLTPADLREHPVWRFTGSDQPSETSVRPLKKLPVKSLTGSLVGCEIRLACGKKVMALLGNLDVEKARLTEHFLTLSVYRDDGKVFDMARYHDVDARERGPDALAAFLKMKKDEVFPIVWDARHLVAGAPSALCGVIEASPKEQLTRAEIIALAVP